MSAPARRTTKILASFGLLILAIPPLPAQTTGINEDSRLVTLPSGEKVLEWFGKSGRTYFIQTSDANDPLAKWDWAPLIEPGNDHLISHEVIGTGENGFFRLQHTNQTAADLDAADFDGDGLSNLVEITPVVIGNKTVQTNPLDPDTDHDGLSDKWERDHGLDPTDDGSINPNNGPNGDADEDGLTNVEEQALGTDPNNADTDNDGISDKDETANGTDPAKADTDGDLINDGDDADPTEILVAWETTPETSYLMIEIEDDGSRGFVNDINGKGELLFDYAIWVNGEWVDKSHPAITGVIPDSQSEINPEGWSYEAGVGRWRFFNNERTLLQVAGFVLTSGPGTDSGGPCPLFWAEGQTACSLIYDTSDLWDDIYWTATALGVSTSGEMLIRNNVVQPGGVTSGMRIDRFDASGVRVATMDGIDDFHPMGNWQHSDTTSSGWVASNMKFEDEETGGSSYKVGLWDAGSTYKILPAEADSWGYPVRISDLPNGKVALVAGSSYDTETPQGRVFLPDASGTYQYATSLSSQRIQLFAGDGAAMTNDGMLWRNGKLIPMRDLNKKWKELEDEDWNFFSEKATKNGTYLTHAFGPSGETTTNIVRPFELSISHPEIVSDSPPFYVVDADLSQVRITAAASPAADGTIIEWEIVEGDGSLSETETTTIDGFSSTLLTTSTQAGDTYKVRARVKKLLLPPVDGQSVPFEFDFFKIGYGYVSGNEKTTASITVLAGFASSVSVAKEGAGGTSIVSLKADGKSEMTLVATVLDQYGQPVEENTPVVWHLAGLGKVTPLAEGTDGDGKIRARLVAGNAVGQQTVRIEASGFEVTEVIDNEAVGTGLVAGTSSLDIATHQTTTLSASFPDVADGAEVKWFSSRGEILNATATVQSGQANATLRAGGGRIGSALVTASVGSSLHSTEVEMTSSAPISVDVVNPVIVGDESVDGTTTVARLDGTMQSVAYHTSTAVKIKASGHAGMPAIVRFGSMDANVVA